MDRLQAQAQAIATITNSHQVPAIGPIGKIGIKAHLFDKAEHFFIGKIGAAQHTDTQFFFPHGIFLRFTETAAAGSCGSL